MSRILVIDDAAELCELLTDYLIPKGTQGNRLKVEFDSRAGARC